MPRSLDALLQRVNFATTSYIDEDEKEEARLIKFPDGSQKRVYAPPSWSDRAVAVVASKYFAPNEHGVRQMVARVLGAVERFAVSSGRLTEQQASVLVADVSHLVLTQSMSFNSPVWFNVGLREEPQASACFINRVDDSMESILDYARTEGLLFKQGSGSGASLSALRPAGSALSGGGTASGPVSFMRGIDSMAGTVKSGGRTRRAAKMVVLDAWHEDALEFVRCKAIAEEKARALAAAGFSADFDDPNGAYSAVGFQNANHSLRVSDDFMARALNERDSEEASLLYEVAKAAWACGDPGLQFDGPIQAEHTCPASGPIRASNPCSEFFFLDETACNLASVNLRKFVEADEFNEVKFETACQLTLVVMELLVDMAGYPTPRIAEMSRDYRPLGLGYSNLGGLLVSLGLGYGKRDGLDKTVDVTALMSAAAWYTSAEMARLWGPFRGLGVNDLDGASSNVRRLRHHVENLEARALMYSSSDYCKRAMLDAREHVEKFGARNAQVTVLAPAGTISLMMDCETTGIEPMVAPSVSKQFVGGGSADVGTRGSPCELAGLRVLGVSDPSERPDVFAYALGDNALPPSAHVETVAAAQMFLSGGVSKTVNMPADATVEDVRDVLALAWSRGCKAVAVYRDGCKGSQPLNVSTGARSTNDGRARLPETRAARVHKFSLGGTEGYLTVGLYEDGRPGEVFIKLAKAGSTVAGFADAFATMVSIALQRGAPLEELVDKMTGISFAPQGLTADSDEALRFASSVPDYVARWMRRTFLDSAVVDASKSAAALVTDGRVCHCCGGGDVVVSGSCHTCRTCGETSGCG